MRDRSKKIKLFISYSHQDEKLCKRLKDHLTHLERNKTIEFWYDRKIKPGENWDSKIKTKLEEADVILFLISADFIASEYIYEVEVKIAMERYKNGDARLIPIMLRHFDLESTRYEAIQGLPTGMKPVASKKYWEDEDEAFEDVVKGLKKIFADIKKEWDLYPLSPPGDEIKPELGYLFCEALKHLDYNEQKDFVYRYLEINKQNFGSFLVHGKPGFGQKWLVELLLARHQVMSRPIIIDVQNPNIGGFDQFIYLLQFRLKPGKYHDKFVEITGECINEIIEEICKLLIYEAFVIVLQNPMNLLITNSFPEFWNRFWVPLCEKACQNKDTHKLLLFMIETHHEVEDIDVEYVTKIDKNCGYHHLLKVPAIKPFEKKDFKKWVEIVKETSEPLLRDKVEELFIYNKKIKGHIAKKCREKVSPVSFIQELFSVLGLQKEDFEDEGFKFE